MLANVRSLRNKIDELQAHCNLQWAYKEANLICITETWLDHTITDAELFLDGFGVPLRADRDNAKSGKKIGGGLCVYVNTSWSRTANIRETYCSPDVELLCVSFRPKYLPREFGKVTLIVVYVPPSGNDARATDVIVDCAQRVQASSPDSPLFIMGDFNSCPLSKSLPTFQHAFNTVQPHLVGQKLQRMNVNPHLILWVLSFLSEREQVGEVERKGDREKKRGEKKGERLRERAGVEGERNERKGERDKGGAEQGRE
ncbi:hypothetical protein WMY93_028415 [Mugilogobius chulae]|uniref:Endonuclease/exonuclease/phosphatase domain-containing protein n=1 Tax=Mugilogobius chulae TaxID=88201 RepID=A0AAW0MUI9_9GOBI